MSIGDSPRHVSLEWAESLLTEMGELGACEVEVSSAFDIPVSRERTWSWATPACSSGSLFILLVGGAMMGVVCKS